MQIENIERQLGNILSGEAYARRFAELDKFQTHHIDAYYADMGQKKLEEIYKNLPQKIGD